MPTKLFIAVLCLCFTVTVSAQVGIGTTTPNPSAMLDVVSTNKGMLVPRVALFHPDSTGPVYGATAGMLVYNTATTGTAPNNVIPGFYYWTGARWFPVVNRGVNFGDMQYWDGTKWVMIPIGQNGQVLTVCNGIPRWGACPVDSLVMKPINNAFEGVIDGFDTNLWQQWAQVDVAAWTNGGSPENRRFLIKFDYTGLPNGVTIDSAKLFLTSNPTPLNGNFIDAQFGGNNACFVQRITSSWTVSNQYSWNNPPTITTSNQAVIPQSTASNQSATIVVTQLVKDMVSFGNNGFFVRLQTELTYNSRQYCSSRHADATKVPKLVIYYH